MSRTGTARTAFRLVRDVRDLRGAADGVAQPYLVEVATAVRTLIEGHAPTRLALRGYRLALRALLAAGVLVIALGLVVLLIGRDGTALVLCAIIVALGALPIWWWWGFSRGLRLLDRYADREREVPLGELRGRLLELAREGEGLPDVSGRLVRQLVRAAEERDAG